MCGKDGCKNILYSTRSFAMRPYQNHIKKGSRISLHVNWVYCLTCSQQNEMEAASEARFQEACPHRALHGLVPCTSPWSAWTLGTVCVSWALAGRFLSEPGCHPAISPSQVESLCVGALVESPC